MLNVALVGLLAGSLLTGATGDDDKGEKKRKQADTQESVVIVEETAPIISDTWALGRSSSASPIKLWIEGGWGQAGEIYRPDGESVDPSVGGGAIIGGGSDIVSTRALVGVEITPFQVAGLSVGLGGTLSAAKNEIKGDAGPLSQTGTSLESDFSVQNLKLYGALRGRALGVHAGYMLDLGDEQEFTALDPDGEGPIPTQFLPTDITRSDNRDAINLGVDFDYPARGVRLFGGLDYYILQEPDEITGDLEGDENVYGEEGDGIWNFMLGTGIRTGIVEFGIAAQIVARDRQPVERNGEGTAGTTPNVGGYVGSIAPYLRISPGSFPAALYVRGAVLDEYNYYGYAIDGANGPRSTIGVTAGLAIGFE